MHVTGTKNRAYQFLVRAIDGAEHEQRQEAMLAVKAVVELELLLPVSRILGRIHIDYDPRRRTIPMSVDEDSNQLQAQTAKLPEVDGVLKAAQRRLRGRLILECQLEKRVILQAVEVVAVFPALADPIDPLRKHLGPRVANVAARPQAR